MSAEASHCIIPQQMLPPIEGMGRIVTLILTKLPILTQTHLPQLIKPCACVQWVAPHLSIPPIHCRVPGQPAIARKPHAVVT